MADTPRIKHYDFRLLDAWVPKFHQFFERAGSHDIIGVIIVSAFEEAETIVTSAAPEGEDNVFAVRIVDSGGETIVEGKGTDDRWKPLIEKIGPMILLVPKLILDRVKEVASIWSRVKAVLGGD
jgi:hypothetical protein